MRYKIITADSHVLLIQKVNALINTDVRWKPIGSPVITLPSGAMIFQAMYYE